MSAYSVTEPFPQFHDRAGNPIEAGYIYVGAAGALPLNTPITAYWDAACTVPAAQPIRTTNGYPTNNGAAARFYVNANDFSITVNDSTNSLVFTALNAGERFPASVITGNFDASQVDYTQGDTGSQVRTVESKLQDTVSVFDFMTTAQIAAVKAGTFLVDVTAPILAAIASPAQEIYFPQGGYLVDNTVAGTPAILIGSVTAGKTLRGAGRQATVIRNVGDGAAIASIGNAIIPNTSITIADMSIEGQPGTGPGVLLSYTSQAVLERLDLSAHGTDGIKVQLGAHISIIDCWSRVNTSDGLLIGDSAFFVDVRGCTFESNSRHGVTISQDGGAASPRWATFTGSAFRTNAVRNVNVEAVRDIRLFGCSSEVVGSGATLRHVSVDGGGGLASSVILDGCSIVGINGAATTVGVYAAACEDLTVSQSVIDCTGSTAYNLLGTASRTRLVQNAIIVGTETDNGTGTVKTTTSTTEYVQTTATSIMRLAFRAITNAFRFRTLVAGGTFPIFEMQGWRIWLDNTTANLRVKSTDPASQSDGLSVGPGLDSYTVATLPVGPPTGTMAIVTDNNAIPVWGAAPAGGGLFKCAVIHWGAGAWTIIGK